jgi:hypothetical protein
MFADFFNLYFLGPLGADGVRLLHLTRQYPNQRGHIVGSLVLDHVGGLFGGFILYASFAGGSGLPLAITSVADKALPWLALVTLLGLGVIMEPPVQRLFGKIPGLRWIAAWMSPLFAGTFRHPWLFSGFAVSTLSTACAFAAYWAAARAVGADLGLPQMLGLMPAAVGNQLLHHPLAREVQVAIHRFGIAHPPILGSIFPNPDQWQPLGDP